MNKTIAIPKDYEDFKSIVGEEFIKIFFVDFKLDKYISIKDKKDGSALFISLEGISNIEVKEFCTTINSANYTLTLFPNSSYFHLVIFPLK